MFRFTIAVLAGLGAAPALAQSSDPPKAGGIVVQGERPEDKKVCRTESVTGSIMPRRVCKTRGQLDEERRKAMAALEIARQASEDSRQVSLIRQNTK